MSMTRSIIYIIAATSIIVSASYAAASSQRHQIPKDTDALSVRGHAPVTLYGWVKDGTIEYEDGHRREIFYLHLESPVDWWPDSKLNARRDPPFHPVVHAYDIQLATGHLTERFTDQIGGSCMKVDGELHSLEWHAAPGAGPLSLVISVDSTSSCGIGEPMVLPPNELNVDVRQ